MEPVPLQLFSDALGVPLSETDNVLVSGVSTDTRTLQPGDLFVALIGEKSDDRKSNGHSYLKIANSKGAVGAVVSEPTTGLDFPLLRVGDTLMALGIMAKSYLSLFKIPVIAVTGSVGKTSTKEMLAHILRTRKKVLASEKNFNNEIGVPQTIFRLALEDDIVVIEMGMRGSGEIARLVEIAEPLIGIITNVGFAHIERLGSLENIARTKAELFAGLPRGGTAIYPADSPFTEILSASIPRGCKRITTSSDPAIKADIELIGPVTVTSNGNGIEFSIRSSVSGENSKIRLKVPGSHHVSNALSAAAAAEICGISLEECAEALATWGGAEGRMEIRKIADNITLLDDCYNAGPESMASAISTLASYPGKRKIAVLGDMRELGVMGQTAHRQIGEQVSRDRIELLITVGDLALDSESGARDYLGFQPECAHFSSSFELSRSICEMIRPGDVVLIKGSHAMEMEVIVQSLMNYGNSAENG